MRIYENIGGLNRLNIYKLQMIGNIFPKHSYYFHKTGLISVVLKLLPTVIEKKKKQVSF